MTVAFVDTETTGLDPDRHEIWEVGAIVDDIEHHWFLSVDPGRADPFALKIGGYHERRPLGFDHEPAEITTRVNTATHERFAVEFARLTRGRHLVGAVVSFDEERLRKLLRANGACPEWHYHLIDVEALAVGYLHGRGDAGEPMPEIALPWDSSELSRHVGVDPDQFDKHTALGDARWAKAIYKACTGGPT